MLLKFPRGSFKLTLKSVDKLCFIQLLHFLLWNTEPIQVLLESCFLPLSGVWTPPGCWSTAISLMVWKNVHEGLSSYCASQVGPHAFVLIINSPLAHSSLAASSLVDRISSTEMLLSTLVGCYWLTDVVCVSDLLFNKLNIWNDLTVSLLHAWWCHESC